MHSTHLLTLLAACLCLLFPPCLRAEVFEAATSTNSSLDTRSGTFSLPATDVPKVIAGSTATTSNLTTSGLIGVLTDVNVTLDLTHPSTGDLTLTLVSPQGTRVKLVQSTSGANLGPTTLDDSATSALSSGSAPYAATFRPVEPLAALNSQPPNGIWSLEIANSTTTTGTWNAWSLQLQTAASPTVFTWAAPVEGNWSDASKWINDQSSGTGPIATGQADYSLRFDTLATGTYTTTNNLNAGFLLNQLIFNGSTVTLSGNSLSFTANGATLPQIHQNASSAITISTPFTLASDLTLGGAGDGPVTISGAISGTGCLTKSGSGTLILNGINSYSGNTTVQEGTLSLGNGTTNTSLADGADVVVDSGCTLRLNYSGTDSIDELWLGGVQKSPGIYGAANSGGLISGTGTLTVTTGPAAATDYETWGYTYGLAAGSEGGDLDNDGLTNLTEYAFGLDPSQNSSANPIAAQFNNSTGQFSYTRRLPSLTGLNYSVWYSTDLSTWTQDASAGQSVTGTAGDVQIVQVSLSPAVLSSVPGITGLRILAENAGSNTVSFSFAVASPPAITTQPASQTISSGTTASLTVTATGTEPLAYQWYQGASGDTTTPVGTNSASFTTPALTITTSYWVKVSNAANPAGVNSDTATITVGTPLPDLVVEVSAPGTTRVGVPFDYTITLRNIGNASTANADWVVVDFTPPPGLSVVSGSASGPGAFEYGADMLGMGFISFYSFGPPLEPGSTTTLTLTVTAATAGTFTLNGGTAIADDPQWLMWGGMNGVNESNETNNLSTQVVNTVVSGAPLITTQPAGKTIPSGSTATLSVVASGYPAPYFQWYQGASGDISTPVGTNSTTFTTPALTATTSYWVKASNNDGSVNSDTATVTVVEPPVVTVDTATDITATSATLHGILNPRGSSGTLKFEYGPTTAYGSTVNLASPTADSTDQAVSTTLGGLAAAIAYHYRLVFTVNGISYSSEDSSFTTYQPEDADWLGKYEQLRNTSQADLMVRVGDIDNLGFGWPAGFNPFLGGSTPYHSHPWTADPSEPDGTDRIMVLSSYNGSPPAGYDGYAYTTTRPDNLPRPITLSYDLQGLQVNDAVFQLFVDDFQAPVWKANYTVTLNGIRYPEMESVINHLIQTGPVGNLISIPVPTSLLPEIAKGNVALLIDDLTTGAGDGYVIDFVKLLVNVRGNLNYGSISGRVTLTNTATPLTGATVQAFGRSVLTDANGYYTLDQVPAGLAFLTGQLTGYNTATAIVNVFSGQTTADVNLSISPAIAPSVSTSQVTSVSNTSATLRGSVNPNGFVTTAQFEYGQTTAYGNTASVNLSPNNGYSPQNFSAVVSNLIAGQTYHYRLTASNSNGVSSGEDMTFTTTTQSGDFKYTAINGQATLTAYTGTATTLNIPSTIDGYPVVSLGANLFYNKTTLTSVTIPNGVTNIGDYAFRFCSKLTSVIIPNSVISIGNYAFYNCSALTIVTIPNSVTTIGSYAFYYCTGLTSVLIPNSVISIGSYAFNYCRSLTSVTIPNSLFFIGAGVFRQCTSLVSVTIPDSITSIGDYAFSNCSALSRVTIPNSVTSIGFHAFSYCTSLTSVTIPSGTTNIGAGAFAYCSKLTQIIVDALNQQFSGLDGVLFSKNRSLLLQCPAGKLGTYGLPNSVTGIGSYAFAGCAGLTSVTIPDSVTNIGAYAFSGCSGFTGVTLPNSITSIGSWAFSGCNSLISVTIPGSVISIDAGAFGNCSTLIEILVNPENPNFSSLNGVLFDKTRSVLVQCPAGKSDTYTIPDGVTILGDYAFYYCRGLTSVSLPNSVTDIRSYAFYRCSALTGMTIPTSVKSIGDSAFYYCSGLTTISIPTSVTSLGTYAFYYCSGLTSITIQGNATNISSYAFYGCSSLTRAVFTGAAPTIGSSVFSNTGAGFTIFYYNGSNGFTSPKWMGYPAINIGVDAAEIALEQPEGAALVSGNSCDFVPTMVGGSAGRVFTIRNVGGLDLQSLALTITGDHASDFIILPSALNSLVPLASTTFEVVFTPSAQGTRVAVLQVASNDADENPFVVNLNGYANAGEGIDQPGLAITSGGASSWYSQTVTTHDGVDAARSGTITHSQDSWMEATLAGPGELSYWWKVSSESGFDHLEFYVDGVRQTGRISGEVDWQKRTHSISAGSHVVRWRYVKDGSITSNQDAAWVDEVVFVPAEPPIITVQPLTQQTIPSGSTATLSVVASGVPAPAFQWYQGMTGDTSTPVAGATSSTFVTPQIGSESQYWVRVANVAGHADSITAVVRVSQSADLSNLELSEGTLAPAFTPGNTKYSTTVYPAVTSVTVTPTTAVAGAVVEVRLNGGSYANVASGNPSAPLNLDQGVNLIEVRVSGQDGTTKIYAISLTLSSGITTVVEYHLGETGSLGINKRPLDSALGGTPAGTQNMTNDLYGNSGASVATHLVFATGSTAYLNTASTTSAGWYGADLSLLPTDNFAFGVFAQSGGRPPAGTAYDVVTLGGDAGAFKLSLGANGWAALCQGVAWIGGSDGVPGTFTPNTWTHLALVRKNGTTTFYVNGIAKGTYTGVPTNGKMHLGVNPGGFNYFRGSMDEARVVIFRPTEATSGILNVLQGLPADQLTATIYQWNGSENSQWDNPANWNPTGTPLGITSGPAPTGGTFTGRINVNSSVPMIYDEILGSTTYASIASVGIYGPRGLVIGSGTFGNGTMIIRGGTFSTVGSVSEDVVSNSGNIGTLIVEGGNFLSSALDVGVVSAGAGNLTIEGGYATIGTFSFNMSGSGTGIINLNGGNFTVGLLKEKTAVGNHFINFNGGLLTTSAAMPAITGLSRINVRDGGARIDTAGYDLTIGQPLSHSNLAGDSAVDGGLVKYGAGKLILAAANTYTGPTSVAAGTLRLDSPSLSDSSLVTVNAAAKIELNYSGTDTVGQLILGNSFMAPGTYSATTHPGFILGTGTLTVAGGTGTPPTISSQPVASQVVEYGAKATLSVSASGTPVLGYQWYRGAYGDTSNPLPGATSASMITPPLEASTSYWVRVTNSAGMVDSDSAVLDAALSSNADLSSLAISSGVLSPSFSPATTSYSTAVPNGDFSMVVTPRAANANATIEVRSNGGNFSTLVSGASSESLALAVGTNQIEIRVTAQNGVIKTYSLEVVRAVPLIPEIVVEEPLGTEIATRATLDFGIGTVGVSATPRIFAIRNAGNVPLSIDAENLQISGTNAGDFFLVVINEGFDTSNPQLLTLSPGASGNLAVTYTPSAGGVASAELSIPSNDPDENPFLVNLTGSGAAPPTIVSQPANQSIAAGTTATLNVGATGIPAPAYQWYQGDAGDTSIPVENATSASFTTPTLNVSTSYWVRVTNSLGSVDSSSATIDMRPPFKEAFLADLVLSSGALSPAFVPSVTTYSATVSNAVSAIEVTPTVAGTGMTVKVNEQPVPSGTSSAPFSLQIGSNVFTTVVTAEDGIATRTYTVTITRAAPASVATLPAEVLDRWLVRLRGTAAPGGTASVFFEYGPTTGYGSATPVQSLTGSLLQNFQADVGGLPPNAPFHFRAVATGPFGTLYGEDFTFTTAAEPPVAATGTPSAVTNSSATLVGAVDPKGLPTTVRFEYGLTTLYGNTTASQQVTTAGGIVDFLSPSGGLVANATYHYRIVATNAAGTSYGEDVAFEVKVGSGVVNPTPTGLPSVTTGGVAGVSTASAILQGSVNPNQGTTVVQFQYGLTSAYGQVTPVQGVGNGTAAAAVAVPAGGLKPGTTYHYRLTASNSVGTAYGQDATFTTAAAPPVVVTGGAEVVNSTTVRVNGTVKAGSNPAEVFVDYGTDPGVFTASVQASPANLAGEFHVPVTAKLEELAQGTTYHYRVRAVGAGNLTAVGETKSFQVAMLSGLIQSFPDPIPARERAGSLMVNLNPAPTGAGWRFLGEKTWRNPGTAATGLTTGDRLIEYRPVAGHAQTTSETVTVTSGQPQVLIERGYTVTGGTGSGSLTVTLRPESITDETRDFELLAKWAFYGETDGGGQPLWRSSEDTVSGLMAGNHLIIAKPVEGRSTPQPVNVRVRNGETTTTTITYYIAEEETGTPPAVVDFDAVSTNPTMPYAYVGQIRTDAGMGSGFVARPGVVATAGHVVFDDGTLASATGVQWLLQQDQGTHEPLPLAPRGYYLLTGYAAQRADDGTPGTSTPASQNLDAAALYFPVDPGRGGFSGYLASDTASNEFLLSDALKTMVGYPVDGIAPENLNRMHATPPLPVVFTKALGRTYTTSDIRGSGGASGGPLCVKHPNGTYYPAAIYLGGTQQMVVRAIDSDVAALVGFAELSAAASASDSGGALTDDEVTTVPTPEQGALEVLIEPAEARGEGAGWRIQASSPYLRSGDRVASLEPNGYTIQFASVPGFETPSPQTVSIGAGELRTVTFTYERIIVPPVITSPDAVVGIRGQPLSHALTASGSQAVFSVLGTLPAGLVFDPVQKLISGTPGEAGSFEVLVGASNSGGSDSRPLVITLLPVLLDQVLTAPYQQMLHYKLVSSESGGGLLYAAQQLPTGLALDSETGVLSGIPETAGTYEIPIHLTRRGATASAVLKLNFTGIAPVIGSTSPVSQTVPYGGSGALSVTASGLPTPSYQWYVGLSGDTSQPIAGTTSPVFATPALTADTRFWVRVSSISGSTDSATFTVGVLPSTNAFLAELTPSSGLLSPPFNPGIFTYTLRVAHASSAISLTSVPEVDGSSVRVQSLAVPAAEPVAVALEVGANPVRVEVTAPDGTTTQTYTLNIDRAPPATANTAATADAGDRSAILAGTVTPNGEATVFFEYGTSDSYGSVTPGIDVSGFDPVPVQALVTGLEPDMLYHYRIVVSSPAGRINGDGLTFVTRPAPPLAATGDPFIDRNSVTTLVGATNPSGRPTTVYFEYGPDTNYGQTTPAATVPAGGNVEDVLFNPPGLTPGMTYHYRLVAENESGRSYGEDVTFQVAPTPGGTEPTPDALPSATILPALDVTSNAALLQASVNPNRGTTFVRFEYGLTPACESSTESRGVGNGTDDLLVAIPVEGLLPGTLYHFRAVATNSVGATTSTSSSFTTAALPPLAVTGDVLGLGVSSARITGSVRARGLQTDVFVEYGENGLDFPNRTRTTPGAVSSIDPVEVQATLSDLPLGRGVFYRLAAERNGTRSTGEVRFFQPDALFGLVQRFTREVPVESRQGTVTVMLNPPGIGGWRFAGERAWRASGASVTGLANGDRVIEFRPVAGYVQPPRETVGVVGGEAPILVGRNYYETPAAPDAGLRVVLEPESIAAPSVPAGSRAQWRLAGESIWRNSGDEIPDLLPGNHLVECRAVPGFATPPVTSVDVISGKVTAFTLTYRSAIAPLLIPPTVVPFATASSSRNLPYAYVGQFRTDSGTHSGFVVKPRVVATTSEAVFDDATLSIRTGMEWLLQRDQGNYEPRPLVPRGAHVFDGYAARRIAEGTPGSLSIESQNLNVAALYFFEDAGRGGYSGFLAGSQQPNEHLVSASLKTLIGYPSGGVIQSNLGRMHATTPSADAFSRVAGQVHASSAIRGLEGMTGGPLCLRFREGAYYPAAIYLGGGAQSLVRAIDSDIVTMFDRAEVSGTGGKNDTGGGITQSSFSAIGTSADPGAIIVNIEPKAARDAGAGWRLTPETTYRVSGFQKNNLTPRDYFLEFKTVSGFQEPATQTVTIQGGKLASITFTYQPVNAAPTITAFANRTITEDATTGAIAFTIDDAEEAASSLTLTKTSSNTVLVPNANIVVGGSGANRTVTVTPAANQSGTATITIKASDGLLTTSQSFVLTVNPVNDAPTISAIANRSINEDSSTGAIAFTIGDVESSLDALQVTHASSNTALVPVSNISLSGSGANRTVTVTPAANQSGTATITVSVSDGSLATSKSFTLTVNPVNDAPTISLISNQSIAFGNPVGPLAFSVADVDTAATLLTVTPASSNPALFPAAGMVVTGTGSNRSLTATPQPGHLGTATLTLTVSDGAANAARSFTVTITGTPKENWRFTNFGSAANSGNAADAADPDGDGQNNRAEFAAGTEPNNPSDFFRVLSSARLASTFRLTVPGRVGRTYALERSASPAGPTWTRVATTGPLAAPGDLELTDPAPTETKGFYRVAVEAP